MFIVYLQSKKERKEKVRPGHKGTAKILLLWLTRRKNLPMRIECFVSH
jgi:hypothetical protein